MSPRKPRIKSEAERERDRVRGRAYYAANRERELANKKAYYLENRDRILAWHRDYDQQPARQDAMRTRSRRRQGFAEPTAETRSGICPVCLCAGPLVCDHDHATGAVRGWLCSACNRHLGGIGDTKEAVERLLRYLTLI